MRIDQRHWRLRPDEGDLEAAFAVEGLGWWVRAGLFVGQAPGSHMADRNFAWWRTRSGGMRGVNVRFGWWPEPCVTLLLHVRPARYGRMSVTLPIRVENHAATVRLSDIRAAFAQAERGAGLDEPGPV